MTKVSKRDLSLTYADREAQKLGQALRAYLLGLFAVDGSECQYAADTCDRPARTRVRIKIKPATGPFKDLEVFLKFKHRIE